MPPWDDNPTGSSRHSPHHSDSASRSAVPLTTPVASSAPSHRHPAHPSHPPYPALPRQPHPPHPRHSLQPTHPHHPQSRWTSTTDRAGSTSATATGEPEAADAAVAPATAAVASAAPQPPAKPKQRRYRATPNQLRELLRVFEQAPSPGQAELAALSATIGMPQQSVVLWFKNRRARVPHRGQQTAAGATSAGQGAAAAANARADIRREEDRAGGPGGAARRERPRKEREYKRERAVVEEVADGSVSASGSASGSAGGVGAVEEAPQMPPASLTAPLFHTGSTKSVPPAFPRSSTTPTSYSTPYDVSHLYHHQRNQGQGQSQSQNQDPAEYALHQNHQSHQHLSRQELRHPPVAPPDRSRDRSRSRSRSGSRSRTLTPTLNGPPHPEAHAHGFASSPGLVSSSPSKLPSVLQTYPYPVGYGGGPGHASSRAQAPVPAPSRSPLPASSHHLPPSAASPTAQVARDVAATLVGFSQLAPGHAGSSGSVVPGRNINDDDDDDDEDAVRHDGAAPGDTHPVRNASPSQMRALHPGAAASAAASVADVPVAASEANPSRAPHRSLPLPPPPPPLPSKLSNPRTAHVTRGRSDFIAAPLRLPHLPQLEQLRAYDDEDSRDAGRAATRPMAAPGAIVSGQQENEMHRQEQRADKIRPADASAAITRAAPDLVRTPPPSRPVQIPAVPEVVEEYVWRAPATPRITSQRIYAPGDRVEVLENPGASSRAWLPATIVGMLREPSPGHFVIVASADSRAADAKLVQGAPLSLGASAASSANAKPATTPVTPADAGEGGERGPAGSGASVWKDEGRAADSKEAEKDDRDGIDVSTNMQSLLLSKRFLSPRPAVPSPEMSPTRANSRVRYVVEVPCSSSSGGGTNDRGGGSGPGDDTSSSSSLGDAGSNGKVATTREIVQGSRLRPEPPAMDHDGDEKKTWRPCVGMAIEVLADSTWRIAEVRSPLNERGFQTRGEDGVICWTPTHRMRPYRKWKGGDDWVVMTKPPVTLLKHAAAFPVGSEFAPSSAMDTDSEASDSDNQLAHHFQTHTRGVVQPPHHYWSDSVGADVGGGNSGNVGTRRRAAANAGATTGPNALRVTRKRQRERERDQESGEGDSDGAPSQSKFARSDSADDAQAPVRRRDGSGPDGLPHGWKVERVERAAGILAGRVDEFYVAPDGRRHRSLREALRSANRN